MEEGLELRAHRDYPGFAVYGYEPKTGKAMAMVGSMEWKGGRVMKGGAQRDIIKEYSAASKARLRKKIWAIPWSTWAHASLVTLTYPAEYPDSRTAKLHLKHMWKRVNRAVSPQAWAIWAFELQKRGAPHFHLLADWGPRSYEHNLWSYKELMYWLSINWADIASDTDNSAHIQAGTRIERIRSIQELSDYVSKPGSKMVAELTKGTQRPDESHGRWWGVLNRNSYKAKTKVHYVDLGHKLGWKVWYEVQEKWAEYLKVPTEERENTHLPQWTEDERYIAKVLREHGILAPIKPKKDLPPLPF